MLSGRLPFEADESESMVDKIKAGKYTLNTPEWAHISKEAKNLIKRMMKVKYSERLTLHKCIDHPWFEKAEELDTEDYLPMSERALDSITLSKEVSKGNKTLVNLLVNFGTTEQHKELL